LSPAVIKGRPTIRPRQRTIPPTRPDHRPVAPRHSRRLHIRRGRPDQQHRLDRDHDDVPYRRRRRGRRGIVEQLARISCSVPTVHQLRQQALDRTVQIVDKKVEPAVAIASLSTPQGQIAALGAGLDWLAKAWTAGSDYLISIPGKTPGELWADFNAFDTGKNIGIVSVLEDTLRQGSGVNAQEDMSYILFGTSPSPTLTDYLTTTAAKNGINHQRCPVPGRQSGRPRAPRSTNALTPLSSKN